MMKTMLTALLMMSAAALAGEGDMTNTYDNRNDNRAGRYDNRAGNQYDSTGRAGSRTSDRRDGRTYGDSSKELRRSWVDEEGTSPRAFVAREMSVDVFGLYVATDVDGVLDDDFGGGAGFNYFFTRYLGVGVEGYAWEGESNTDNWVGTVNGNLILRYPFERLNLAPYVFGGPGGHFGPETEFSGQLGGGLEYRFTRHFGLFADARYVFVENMNDYIMPRVGLRYRF